MDDGFHCEASTFKPPAPHIPTATEKEATVAPIVLNIRVFSVEYQRLDTDEASSSDISSAPLETKPSERRSLLKKHLLEGLDKHLLEGLDLIGR